MARQKKSMFEWLTGGAEADNDYSFEDIESGSSFGSPARPTSKAAAHELAEEPVDGELAVDVHQTPSHIIIKAMIAGVKPEDLDVSITRDMVTVRGKRERHTESQSGDYFFQELYWGSFARTIVLPQEVEIEEAEATEKHGLLTIKLPKVDKGRAAKLKVKSN
jgi:HSP20 family molecular chaperone IbpA